MTITVKVLGCGNSTGIPAIGNYWGTCDPQEPKNRRTRCSIIVENKNTRVLIDTGPDIREQFNREDISAVDAVLYTHAHSDHINGIDELRVLKHRNKKIIPVYSNRETIAELSRRFDYIFEGGKHELYPPLVEPHVFGPEDMGRGHEIGDISFVPFAQDHATCESVGYRFGSFAYSVDMWRLDNSAIMTLKGIETWMVDCAAYRDTANKVHANLDVIMRLNEKIGAQKIILTSLSLSMDYQTLIKELPSHVIPAYDGMVFEIPSFS